MKPRGHVQLMGYVYPSVRRRVHDLRRRFGLRVGDILTTALEQCADVVFRNLEKQIPLPLSSKSSANTAGERAGSGVDWTANAPSPLEASSEPASAEAEGVADEGDKTEGSSSHG